MPKLTVGAIKKYRGQARRREVWDSLAPGLVLVVQTSGAKSFALRFRRPDGRLCKLTLGRCIVAAETDDEPVLGGPHTLAQAREHAFKIARQRARGVDVIEEYKARKSRQRVEQQGRVANTFGKAARQFFADYRTKFGRVRRWRSDARLLGLSWPKEADPAKTEPTIIKGSLVNIWADKVVTEIDSFDVHTIIEAARKLGIPGTKARNKDPSDNRARKLHSALSVLFRWLLRQQRVAVNPCSGVWHGQLPQARDRVLSDAEIAKFWNATKQVGEPFRGALRLLLLTGARLNEVVGMRRDELHEDGNWHLPAARTKNHLPHIVPLSPLTRDTIAQVPHIEGGLCFTTNGRTPISGWSKCKRQLDLAMCDVPPWRIHDLRRTVATHMGELGILPHVIEACLNHISGAKAGVAGTYNRSVLMNERTAALARWAAHISGLIAAGKDKVVALKRGRK